MPKNKNTYRDNQGKYDYGNMELICVCGHKLSVHSGPGYDEHHKIARGCLNEDIYVKGATGEHCNCRNFKKAKKQLNNE
jgi:hypothetical protein